MITVGVINDFIADKGVERVVQGFAIIGAYTTGKLVVKGVRKLRDALNPNGKEVK